MIGKMRHSINFQELTVEPNSYSASGTNSYEDSIPAKAEIRPVSASEAVTGEKIEHVVTHEIRTRYQSGITAKHRIRFGTRYFKVVQILNLFEKSRYLRILATEEDGEGS